MFKALALLLAANAALAVPLIKASQNAHHDARRRQLDAPSRPDCSELQLAVLGHCSSSLSNCKSCDVADTDIVLADCTANGKMSAQQQLTDSCGPFLATPPTGGAVASASAAPFERAAVARAATVIGPASTLLALSGEYAAAKDILGHYIRATVTIEDVSHLTLELSGAAALHCAGERYELSGSGGTVEVSLPDETGATDCIHAALASTHLGLELSSIAYDTTADSVTVTIKKHVYGSHYMHASMLLTKAAGARRQLKVDRSAPAAAATAIKEAAAAPSPPPPSEPPTEHGKDGSNVVEIPSGLIPVVREMGSFQGGDGQQLTTYQLSLRPEQGADIATIYAIYGDEEHPLRLPAAYQAAAGGVDIGGTNPLLTPMIPDLAHDSWLTIGATDGSATATLASVGIDFDLWSVDHELSTTDGAVFFLNPAVGPRFAEAAEASAAIAGGGGAGVDLEAGVVVAQVTVPTEGWYTATVGAQGYRNEAAADGGDNGMRESWEEPDIQFMFGRTPPPAADGTAAATAAATAATEDGEDGDGLTGASDVTGAVVPLLQHQYCSEVQMAVIAHCTRNCTQCAEGSAKRSETNTVLGGCAISGQRHWLGTDVVHKTCALDVERQSFKQKGEEEGASPAPEPVPEPAPVTTLTHEEGEVTQPSTAPAVVVDVTIDEQQPGPVEDNTGNANAGQQQGQQGTFSVAGVVMVCSALVVVGAWIGASINQRRRNANWAAHGGLIKAEAAGGTGAGFVGSTIYDIDSRL